MKLRLIYVGHGFKVHIVKGSRHGSISTYCGLKYIDAKDAHRSQADKPTCKTCRLALYAKEHP